MQLVASLITRFLIKLLLLLTNIPATMRICQDISGHFRIQLLLTLTTFKHISECLRVPYLRRGVPDGLLSAQSWALMEAMDRPDRKAQQQEHRSMQPDELYRSRFRDSTWIV